MFSFRTTSLLEQPDLVLKRGKLGVLCNQTAWDPERGEYLFETIAKHCKLTKVFMPEHGLFGELQDQVKLNSGDSYNKLLEGVEFISLYGSKEESLAASLKDLQEIDQTVRNALNFVAAKSMDTVLEVALVRTDATAGSVIADIPHELKTRNHKPSIRQ